MKHLEYIEQKQELQNLLCSIN